MLASAGTGLSADWPNWRGPNHDGISNETDWQAAWPAQGPRVAWRANVGTGFSSFAVVGDRVFTVGNRGNIETVYCFQASNGTILWRFTFPARLDAKYYEGGPSATPTVDGGHLYTFSKRGLVHCLNAATGDVVWETNLDLVTNVKAPTWGFAGSVLARGDLLILNAGEAGMALDKRSGAIAWTSGRGPGGYSTPVPLGSAGPPAVVLMGDKQVVAVRVADGYELWRHPWKTQHGINAADPIVTEDQVFITAGYNHGCALLRIEQETPVAVWQNKNMRSQFASAVLWKGLLFGVDDRRLVCLDARTGAKRWEDRRLGKGSLMMADGKIIALSDKGELFVAAPSVSGFEIISRAQVLGGKCWTVPVLANGRIFCRNSKGDVVCLDVQRTSRD